MKISNVLFKITLALNLSLVAIANTSSRLYPLSVTALDENLLPLNALKTIDIAITNANSQSIKAGQSI